MEKSNSQIASLFLIAFAAGCAAPIAREEGISYDDRFGEATTLDVYRPDLPDLPDDENDNAGRPAVILIHGGGWHLYGKDVYVDQATRLAEAGFVAISINYRLVPDGTYPALIRDCYCALAFIGEHAADYGIDPARIAVAGYSAGGHLASLLGATEAIGELTPDCAASSAIRPAAVIAGAGPQDMALLPQNGVVIDFLGGTLEEVPERYALASPITHVSADDPPFLFIHGTGDLFVDVDHSRQMAKALRDVGVVTRELELRGGGHILNPGGTLLDAVLPITTADTPEGWAATIAFLDDALAVKP